MTPRGGGGGPRRSRVRAHLLGGEEMVARLRLELGAQRRGGGDALEKLGLALLVKDEVEPRAQLALARAHPLHLELGLLRVEAHHLARQERVLAVLARVESRARARRRRVVDLTWPDLTWPDLT